MGARLELLSSHPSFANSLSFESNRNLTHASKLIKVKVQVGEESIVLTKGVARYDR